MNNSYDAEKLMRQYNCVAWESFHAIKDFYSLSLDETSRARRRYIGSVHAPSRSIACPHAASVSLPRLAVATNASGSVPRSPNSPALSSPAAVQYSPSPSVAVASLTRRLIRLIARDRPRSPGLDSGVDREPADLRRASASRTLDDRRRARGVPTETTAGPHSVSSPAGPRFQSEGSRFQSPRVQPRFESTPELRAPAPTPRGPRRFVPPGDADAFSFAASTAALCIRSPKSPNRRSDAAFAVIRGANVEDFSSSNVIATGVTAAGFLV